MIIFDLSLSAMYFCLRVQLIRYVRYAVKMAKTMLSKMSQNQNKCLNLSWESKYSKIKTLGNGGNACVILVQDKNGNQFALKPLNKEYISRTDKQERFLREVDVMKNKLGDLQGVIPVIDSCENGYWYIMPVANKSMDVIKEMGLEQRINAFLVIAETLKIIHSRKISHRDIKPANILYFENHFCFCDFGLCHIENSVLTEKRDNIGAKFTIAPEMRRDSKCSDPYRADVYSMGKTLWMFLTENENAFEGTYSPLESSIGLHYYNQYKDSNIAEIEFLLEDATKNNPDDRPTINEFCNRLRDWITISKTKDFAAMQRSELKMIKHYFSPSCEINSLTITTPKDIVEVLNYFRLAPMLNHMLYPQGGGLDFYSAEMASEEDCIALISQRRKIDILKPKQFVFESMNDYKWFYFLLEADKLTPVLTTEDVLSENLIEDIPGHYCDALDYSYGVYDYDSGKKLPQTARLVERYCRGTFLILPKLGYYNQLTSTYDGRHNNCTVNEFREYIQIMKKYADDAESKGYTFQEIVYVLDNLPNPYKYQDDDCSLNELRKTVSVPRTFILDIVGQLDISYTISRINDMYSPATFAMYVINKELECPNDIFCCYEDEIHWFLCNDGKIQKTSWKDKKVLKLHSRSKAKALLEEIVNTINNLYNEAGFENNGVKLTECKMTLYRTGKPTHMFTKEEIKALMKSADDRLNNTLVIDEFGFAQVISGHFDKRTYPVSQETWCSRNNYVGKYSGLFDLEESYEWMLDGWLDYLERCVTVFKDNKSRDLTIPELLKKIKVYYK